MTDHHGPDPDRELPSLPRTLIETIADPVRAMRVLSARKKTEHTGDPR
jgi:hypothetical protein